MGIPQNPTDASAVEELLGRSAVYRALAVLLRRPDAAAEAWLARGGHLHLPEVAARLSAADGGSRLADAAKAAADLLGRMPPGEWVRQHEGVFGHSVHGAAPPYELEYGLEHSHRQPQELSDIAAFYAAFGLRAASTAHERVDHVVAECEFLQYLLYKQACALDEETPDRAEICGEAARRFLGDHLGFWGSAFALRLSRAGEGSLPAAAGALLLEWLLLECSRMGVEAGSVDMPLRAPREGDAGCVSCAWGGDRGNACP